MSSNNNPKPALTRTCNCDPCREGEPADCEVAAYEEMARAEHEALVFKYKDLDFGMRTPAGNAALRDILSSLIDNIEERPCPCWVLDTLDAFDYAAADGLLPEGITPADPEEVREHFLKHYKDYSELEECEEDECNYPHGIDCTPDPSDALYEQACAREDWAAWSRGQEAAGY